MNEQVEIEDPRTLLANRTLLPRYVDVAIVDFGTVRMKRLETMEQIAATTEQKQSGLSLVAACWVDKNHQPVFATAQALKDAKIDWPVMSGLIDAAISVNRGLKLAVEQAAGN